MLCPSKVSAYDATGTGWTCWFYGSKDAILVVVKDSGNYYATYFGTTIPVSNPNNTATTAVVSAGAAEIEVADTDLFVAGGKYRIIAKSLADWHNNEDRTADTHGGATPGDWDDLDMAEMPTEEVVVQSVDGGGGKIILDRETIYSYQIGAVIGEDPILTVSFGTIDGSQTFRSSNTASMGTDCYSPQSRDGIHSYATQRQRYRAYHVSGQPWNQYTSYVYQCALMLSKTPVPGGTYQTTSNQNRQNEQLIVGMWTALLSTSESSFYLNGIRNRSKGILPFPFWINNQLGGTSEDTVQAMWNGQFETFRMFDEDQWILCGPEIWP